jgi:hypothetical protein
MPEPIWCLNEVQLNEMSEKIKLEIRKSGADDPIYFPLRLLRRIAYLYDERFVDRHNASVAYCKKRNIASGDTTQCPEPGMDKMEEALRFVEGLDNEDFSGKDGVKMRSVFERFNAIRSEYPVCK